MNSLLQRVSDDELKEIITNIDAKNLCLLMTAFDENDKNRIYSVISEEAKKLLDQDIEKIKDAISTIKIP